jgi:hypothetical protein
MEIDLSTGAPASPARTLRLAAVFAELARVLNHQALDHGAFGVPANADRVLREYLAVAERMPEFLSHLARWVALEDEAGRIGVPSGEWAGHPHTAVTALQVRLDAVRAGLEQARADLASAAEVTSVLAEADPEGDGDD